MKLPRKYKPKVLRKETVTPKRTRYAIAIEHKKDEFGFNHGPFKKLIEALEIVPEENNSVIFKLYSDGNSKILYKWKNDTWVWYSHYKE